MDFTALYAKIMTFFTMLQYKLEGFFKDEDGEVNIVAIVVLVAIAIILAAIFKDQIKRLLNTLFTAITGKATEVVEA